MVYTSLDGVGCPVMRALLVAMDAETPKDDEQFKAVNERSALEMPTLKATRQRAILCVAYGLEEIAFGFQRAEMAFAADAVRALGRPIVTSKDLEPIEVGLRTIGEEVTAEVMQFKMIGVPATTEQLQQQTLRGISMAVDALLYGLFVIRTHWNDQTELAPCGRQLALVFRAMSTPGTRRLGYAGAIMEAPNHV